MTKTSIVLVTAALLGLSGNCGAQLAGVTPEMIASALPEEGAPQALPGPYHVATELGFEAPNLRVFRPADLDRFSKRDLLPLLVWGNGGCAVSNPRYAGFLSTIASHGFLVVTTETVSTEAAPVRRQVTAADLKAAIDWADRENARPGSALNGKIATDRIAVMGQSCGGSLAIALGADPRVGTIGVFNSGVPARGTNASSPAADPLALLHGPVLLINGGERDFMMARSKATYDAISALPAFYGSRHGAGHTATMYHPGGGEFANVASNWLLWQFKGDKKAGAMFLGAKCALCTDPNWDAQSKRLQKGK